MPPRTDGCGAALLRYRYDADDNRVIKSAKQLSTSAERHTVYVFDTLELRLAAYGTPTANEYDLNMNTEVPYLFANGVRLARVAYEPTTPMSSPSAQHVFLELGDHLGSTSTVLDKATGELVEKSTYQAYGAAESDFRPEQWKEFREDYRFTGKEEDVEVGLVYFGKRYYSAQLNRWMSPDPLGVHSPGAADLNLYAYVRGQAFKSVDPKGLQEMDAHKVQAETACVLPCATALEVTKLTMKDNGQGERMLSHFLSGSSAPLEVPLQSMIDSDAKMRETVTTSIENQLKRDLAAGRPVESASGSVWVGQGSHDLSEEGQDNKYALGGTWVEYDINGTESDGRLMVGIQVADHYFWSPSEPRTTQCLHECGKQLVSEGRANEFFQTGQAEIVVSPPDPGEPQMSVPEETYATSSL